MAAQMVARCVSEGNEATRLWAMSIDHLLTHWCDVNASSSPIAYAAATISNRIADPSQPATHR